MTQDSKILREIVFYDPPVDGRNCHGFSMTTPASVNVVDRQKFVPRLAATNTFCVVILQYDLSIASMTQLSFFFLFRRVRIKPRK